MCIVRIRKAKEIEIQYVRAEKYHNFTMVGECFQLDFFHL